MATRETRKMVLAAAAVCEEKKAENTRVLELDPADSGFTDFFLITSGTNTRQTVAIADDIEMKMKREFGTYANSVEGRRAGEWILMDYVDFVVHIFVEEKRAFYDIERLRKSARSIDVTQLKVALSEKTAASRRVHPRPTEADQTQAEAEAEARLEPATEAAAVPARKSAGKKTTLGKRVSAARKSAARKSADAGKKSPGKKAAPARKSATRIAAAAGAQSASGQSSVAKKTGAKKPGAKKTGAKQAGSKQTAAQKTAARRSAKKTAAKKSRPRPMPGSKSDSEA